MKKLLMVCLVLSFLLAASAFAADYYVANNGNDDDSITTGNPDNGRFPETPWQTIDKINNSSFQPGDTIHFKCEDKWHEQLDVPNSNITIKIYPDNCTKKPIINAAIDIANFSSTQYPGIYVTDVSGLPGTVNQLFVDDKYIMLAQHPNPTSLSKYLIVDQNSTSYTYLIDTALAGSLPSACNNNLEWAGVHARTYDWFIDTSVIDRFDPIDHKLYFKNPTKYTPQKDYGYYLDNKLCFLDSAGEWYFDSGSNQLFVWLPVNELDNKNPDPNTHIMEASIYDYGINIDNKSQITIDGLEIKHAAGNGINVRNSPGFHIVNVEISDSGHDGIYVSNSEGQIQGSKITNSVNEGINTEGSTGCHIIGNIIESSGAVGSPRSSIAAVVSGGWSSIKNNTIVNSGYHGIRFGRGSTIENNVVENSCLVLDDCGGIYTWNGNPPYPSFNSSVIGNIVINSVGNIDGTPRTTSISSGIYLDDLSRNVKVLNNTVVNASQYGIMLHNTIESEVGNNTIYGSGASQLSINESGEELHVKDILKRNIITGNIIFPTASNVPVFLSGQYYNIDFGTFDSNIYSTLYTNDIVVESYWPDYVNANNKGDQVRYSYELSKWQEQQRTNKDGNLMSMDTNPIRFNPFSLIAERLSSINSEIMSSSFNLTEEQWNRWSSIGDAVMSHEPGCNVTGGCLKFTSGRDSIVNALSRPKTSEVFLRTM